MEQPVILEELVVEADREYSTKLLKYPSDLESSIYGGHYINFYIYLPPSASWKTSGSIPAGISTDRQTSSTDSYTQSQIDKTVLNLTSGLGVVTDKMQDLANKALSFIGKGFKSKLSEVISLYMPDTISLNQQAAYENESFTKALGTNLGLIIGAGHSVVDTDSNAPVSTAMQEAASFGGEAGVITAATAAGADDPNALARMALNTTGYAINPQMQVIFKEMNFRSYNFDFFLTARNADEASQIKDIVKMFRYHQAPDFSGTTVGRYYILPSVFDIEYIFNGKSNENLHKIATCVLKSVNVDYAPNGFVTYHDGMPAQVRLTLQFQEKEVMTKQRIDQGY